MSEERMHELPFPVQEALHIPAGPEYEVRKKVQALLLDYIFGLIDENDRLRKARALS